MHFTVLEHGELFRLAFLFGVLLGAYYDTFRFLRALGYDSKRAAFFQDITFMTSAGVMCFMFAQTTVHGHFRVFIMTAHLLGLLCYRFSVGIITGRLYAFIGIVFKKTSRLVNEAVKLAGKLIVKISANLSRKIKGVHVSKPVQKQQKDETTA